MNIQQFWVLVTIKEEQPLDSEYFGDWVEQQLALDSPEPRVTAWLHHELAEEIYNLIDDVPNKQDIENALDGISAADYLSALEDQVSHVPG